MKDMGHQENPEVSVDRQDVFSPKVNQECTW